MQEITSDEDFHALICSSDYDFLSDCGVLKSTAIMNLNDKDKVNSGVCLRYAVLGSLAELEQLRRGLIARFSMLLEQHKSLYGQLFIHHNYS